jgi:hypothetical protein
VACCSSETLIRYLDGETLNYFAIISLPEITVQQIPIIKRAMTIRVISRTVGSVIGAPTRLHSLRHHGFGVIPIPALFRLRVRQFARLCSTANRRNDLIGSV